MQDDIELLRRYAEGATEEAFTELVRRHLNLVYSAALRRVGGDVHLAEDVTQQVFTALARQAPVLARRTVLTGWLYTTARFASARVVRAERRRQAREQEAYIMNEYSTPDPDWDRLRPVLDAVMDQMSEREREALLLRFFEGRPFAEVGAKLALTEDAARMRVERALEKLRTLLARRGIGSTTAAVALMLGNQTVTAAPVGLAAAIAGNSVAAVSGVTSTTFNLLQFMSTSKITAGAMTILAFVALGTATYEVHASHAANAALAVTNQDIDAAQLRLRELEGQAQAAEQGRADLQQAIAGTRDARAADEARVAKALAENAAKIRDPIAVGQAFVAAHPEAPGLVVDYQRARMLERYGLLFQRMNLTPAQIDRFHDLLVQSQGGLGWQTAQQAPAGRFNVGTTGLSREEMESRLHDLLGDAGYAQYLEYDRSMPARQVVAGLAGVSAFTGAPLSAAQADQFTQVLLQNSADFRSGRRVNTDSIDWDTVLPELGKFLSAAQVKALGDLQQQQLYQRALSRAANRGESDAMKAVGQDISTATVR